MENDIRIKIDFTNSAFTASNEMSYIDIIFLAIILLFG